MKTLRTQLPAPKSPGSWWCRSRKPTSAGRWWTSPVGRRNQLIDAIHTTTCHPFDLAAEIPLRAKLFRAAADDGVGGGGAPLPRTGWSITPLMADLGVALPAGVQGQPPGWDPLPVQYVDYTLWQRAKLGQADDSHSPIAAQLAYWQDALCTGCPSSCGSRRPIGPIRQ